MEKKHIVLISNSFGSLYNFRYELILTLLQSYQITLLTPMEKKDYENYTIFKENGCALVETPFQRRGKNPIAELRLKQSYESILSKLQPNLVITYTIKPNIYGGMACAKLGIPYFNNVTGLGKAFEKNGLLRTISVELFRRGAKNAALIFFQNSESKKVFETCRIGNGRSKLVPGSGINLEKFSKKEYTEDISCNFLYMARIMKAKGAEEFFEAAVRMKAKYPNVKFDVVGFCEEAYESKIEELQKNKVIIFHGWQDDTKSFLEQAGCLVNPSHHEGMSNVCLEAAATGRPMIVSDIPGCRETIEHGKSGFVFPVTSTEALYQAMEQFYQLPFVEKKQMGDLGRVKMEQEFDRKLVVEEYQNEIRRILENDEN